MKHLTFVIISIFCLGTVGCTSTGFRKKPLPEKQVVEAYENPVPGTVDTIWEEPMYDTVRIPGQIDPHGTYYRLPHRNVVEIRPGRAQQVQFPKDITTQENKTPGR